MVYKPRPISGFPEWLPEERIVELRWMDYARSVFESYGFCSLSTPAVEEIEVLAAKGGDTDKEIYALRRLQGGPGDDDARVALHYDLTVPLARYVAAHYNDLVMPFKRYQIQPAWRGERPQEGRYREFTQADIDIVDIDTVSIHFDAELPAIVAEVLDGLGVGPYTIHVNNRKILQGFYEGLGIRDVVGAIRIVDKIDKVGRDGIQRLLVDDAGLPSSVAERCAELAEISSFDLAFVDRIDALDVKNDTLDAGLEELVFVMTWLMSTAPNTMLADLSIARGFDYYTGTVYEGKLGRFPSFPSICAGGRYDDLVGSYLRKKLPGVGISIGLTRIFAKLLKEGLIPLGAKCPTEMMIAFPPDTPRDTVTKAAADWRARGIKVEAYHEPHKLQKQLRYASRKGIRYVCFPGANGAPEEVKDLDTGEQAPISADWRPSTV